MNKLLRYIVIALLVVVGVIVLAVCSEGVCSSFAEVCCGGARRSQPASGIGASEVRNPVPAVPSWMRPTDTFALAGSSPVRRLSGGATLEMMSLRI